MPRKLHPLILDDGERIYLKRLVEGLDSDDALRANLILLASEGLANKDVADRLAVHVQTVDKWRRRFLKDRLRALQRRGADPNRPDRGLIDGLLDHALRERNR